MGAYPNNCAAAVAMADGPATSPRAAASPQRMYSPRVVVFRPKRNHCGQFQILLARLVVPALVVRPSFPRSKKENQRHPLSAHVDKQNMAQERNKKIVECARPPRTWNSEFHPALIRFFICYCLRCLCDLKSCLFKSLG